MTSYIKILQIKKLKSKDNTTQTLHAKFYASGVKNERIRKGSVFKSSVKIGLNFIFSIKILKCCYCCLISFTGKLGKILLPKLQRCPVKQKSLPAGRS